MSVQLSLGAFFFAIKNSVMGSNSLTKIFSKALNVIVGRFFRKGVRYVMISHLSVISP